jgi:hypothetical protein
MYSKECKMTLKNFNPFFVVIMLISVLSSCAVAGNVIHHANWVGMLDLITATGIAIFILRGSKK